MPFSIAFYVHHHGSGHLMRTLQIASALGGRKIFLMGSALDKISIKLPEHIELIHLPADTPHRGDLQAPHERVPDIFHYAPTGVSGVTERTAIMTDLFKREFPIMLIVDVSVEVTLLARLCSVPTIVMLQHGIRNDLPHLMAYQSAALLLAPYPSSLYVGEKNWVFNKTVFTGGFSRFNSNSDAQKEHNKNIAVLIGAGGSSINNELIDKIAREASTYTFHILGNETSGDASFNIFWHGQVQDPQQILEKCRIVIGNTGHNTVMEVASLDKRFIGIPEERPFAEQVQKALSIEKRKGVRIIPPLKLRKQHWEAIFNKLSEEVPDWEGIINPGAIGKMAREIICMGNRLFGV